VNLARSMGEYKAKYRWLRSVQSDLTGTRIGSRSVHRALSIFRYLAVPISLSKLLKVLESGRSVKMALCRCVKHHRSSSRNMPVEPRQLRQI